MTNPPPPRRFGRPVWQTREELRFVLTLYRKWYDEGRSDVEISALIRAKFTEPHNPQTAWRGKRR